MAMSFGGAIHRRLRPNSGLLSASLRCARQSRAAIASVAIVNRAPYVQREVDRRALHTTAYRRNDKRNDRIATAAKGEDMAADQSEDGVLAVYTAPLAKTFFRLKLFSLGSLALSSALCPALLLAPAEVGLAGRLGLCAVALATSGASTTLIAWIGRPYIGLMTLLSSEAAQAKKQEDVAEASMPELASDLNDDETSAALEVTTTDFRLRVYRTTIYEPSMLRGTSRPFATWELAAMPAPREIPVDEQTVTKLVAATRNAETGQLVGTRWAQWSAETLTKASGSEADFLAEGKTIQHGHVPRHFSVHEDKLDERWQVL